MIASGKCLSPFIFSFFSPPFSLGDGSKNIWLGFIPKSVLPMFSSRSFIALNFAFRSLIHFEFIFVYGVRNILIPFFYM